MSRNAVLTSSLSNTWQIILGVVPITCKHFITEPSRVKLLQSTTQWPKNNKDQFNYLSLLPVLGQDSPPGHDHHQVADVRDVGDRPQTVVHHYLLTQQ